MDLLPPQGCALKAAAFSWQGDKLCLCLEEEGAPSRRKLAAWNVPAECIDTTSPGTQSDQADSVGALWGVTFWAGGLGIAFLAGAISIRRGSRFIYLKSGRVL